MVRVLCLLAAFLLPTGSALSQPAITLQTIMGEWFSSSRDEYGYEVQIHAVLNGSEWTSTSQKTIIGMLGQPVTYKSAQGGMLEIFPPATIRFSVFWQQPNEINGRGIDLPPGSTFTIEQYDGQNLVLADTACMQQLPKNQCIVAYQRLR